MMKRLVATVFFLGLLLLASALVVPNFVDWNRHRDRIAAALSARLDTPVTIGGAVEMRVLPAPRLVLGDVAVGGEFLRLKRLEIRIRPAPLLNGRVEAERLVLEEPKISVSVSKEGEGNWPRIPAKGRVPVQLDSVEIAGGSVRYADARDGATFDLSGIGAELSAASLRGPVSAKGTAGGAAFTLRTEAFDPAARTLVFTLDAEIPGGWPAARLSGTAGPGWAAKGKVSLAGGPPTALSADPFLGAFVFLEKPAKIEAEFTARPGEAELTALKAQLGGGGSLEGEARWSAGRDGRLPALSAKLKGEGIALALPRALPGGFKFSGDFEGKDIVVEGARMESLKVAAESTAKDWLVKQLQVRLPGGTDLRAAGMVTPASGIGNFAVQGETQDFGRMLAAMPLDKASALPLFGLPAGGSYSLDFDFRPGNLRFSSIDAKIGDAKLTGAVDIARGTPKPAFVAGLALNGWKTPRAGGAALLKALAAADGMFSLNLSDYDDGTLKAREIRVKGKTDGSGGIVLEDLTAVTGEDEGFDLEGSAAEVGPLERYSFTYGLKAADGLALARALGIPLPPPVGAWTATSVHGKISSSAFGATAFTMAGSASGTGLKYEGGYTPDKGFSGTFALSGGSGAVTSLPFERLFAGPGGLALAGTVSGTREACRLENLSGNGVTGSAKRADAAWSAALTLPKIDFDAWTWDDWADAGEVALQAPFASWRGLRLEDARMALRGEPGRVTIPILSGRLWNGALGLSGAAVKGGEGGWISTFSGALAAADIAGLAAAAGLHGVSAGKGGFTMAELSWPGRGLPGDFAALSGKLAVTAQDFRVDGFSPSAVSAALSKAEGPVPSLQQMISAALKSKDETYAKAEFPLVFSDGSAALEGAMLQNGAGNFAYSAQLDLSAKTYTLWGTLSLAQPATAPGIVVRRADAFGRTGDYGVELKLNKTLPAGDDAVRGIVKRLEQSSPPAEDQAKQK